jgi:hypothetical protein
MALKNKHTRTHAAQPHTHMTRSAPQPMWAAAVLGMGRCEWGFGTRGSLSDRPVAGPDLHGAVRQIADVRPEDAVGDGRQLEPPQEQLLRAQVLHVRHDRDVDHRVPCAGRAYREIPIRPSRAAPTWFGPQKPTTTNTLTLSTSTCAQQDMSDGWFATKKQEIWSARGLSYRRRPNERVKSPKGPTTSWPAAPSPSHPSCPTSPSAIGKSGREAAGACD